jgi:hypothetical protein
MPSPRFGASKSCTFTQSCAVSPLHTHSCAAFCLPAPGPPSDSIPFSKEGLGFREARGAARYGALAVGVGLWCAPPLAPAVPVFCDFAPAFSICGFMICDCRMLIPFPRLTHPHGVNFIQKQASSVAPRLCITLSRLHLPPDYAFSSNRTRRRKRNACTCKFITTNI